MESSPRTVGVRVTGNCMVAFEVIYIYSRRRGIASRTSPARGLSGWYIPTALVHNKDSIKMMIYQNGRSRRRLTEKGASARDKDAASGRSPGASAHARDKRDATPLFVGRPFNGGPSCNSK